MIARALYLAVGWFAFSLVVMLGYGVRLRRASAWLSLGWLLVVLGVGDLWALLTFGVPQEIAFLSLFAFLFGWFWILLLPNWNALGHATWSTVLLATGIFIIYAFAVTAFTPLNPFSFLLAMVFFFIEMAALGLGLTHAYESLDVMCRVNFRRATGPLKPLPGYIPKVSLQVPAYNEPPEVVEATLRSLAKLDYPNYEVLLVDNNTPDESTWRPLESVCRQLGPHFKCVHLDKWPGYKSGALNFALTQIAPDAEIVGIIDTDYRVDPAFLRETVPAFANPEVAFLQTPQDYRDWDTSPFMEATYHGYKYFFEVSMPSRNEHNAIIFAGTMGLIRKSVFQEIGGFFSSVGLDNLGGEYNMSGQAVGGGPWPFFVANAGAAIWAAPHPISTTCGDATGGPKVGPQQVYDRVLATKVTPNSYYGNAWRLLSLLLLSGNFPNFYKMAQGAAVSTPTPTPTPPTVNASGNKCRVNYQITQEWGSGFTADVFITNTSDITVKRWNLRWTFPNDQTITYLWNGRYSQSGAVASVNNVDWNGIISSGETINFGFVATYSKSNQIPDNFILNGVVCQQGGITR